MFEVICLQIVLTASLIDHAMPITLAEERCHTVKQDCDNYRDINYPIGYVCLDQEQLGKLRKDEYKW